MSAPIVTGAGLNAITLPTGHYEPAAFAAKLLEARSET
jgi:hypothetical protein